MRISLEVLKRLYVDERMTAGEVAARIGSSSSAVLRWLRRHGIPARPRGPRRENSRKPAVPPSWSSGLAWAIGIIATDGNLSPDGRHLCVVSQDLDLLETLRSSLELDNRIVRRAGSGRVYQLQWSHRAFYDWLLGIGLTPRKSLTLGPLSIPDEWFVDFFRGCIDGDGSIVTYVDRYNTFKKPTYVYVRLYVSIVSASPGFVEWLRATVKRLRSLAGSLTVTKHSSRHDIWRLKYAKRESLALIRWMYAEPQVPCLRRKREIAAEFLVPRVMAARRGPGRPVVV